MFVNQNYKDTIVANIVYFVIIEDPNSLPTLNIILLKNLP